MFLARGNYCNTIHIVKSFTRIPNRSMSSAKKPILYGDVASPPVRVVMMTASILNIDYEFKEIDLFKAEHKTEFFKTINPLQKVPALVAEGEIIRDSHAIATYLCRMHNNNDLYPEENMLRTKIDEMMHFDSFELFPVDSALYYDFFAGKPHDDIKLNKWYAALDYLELKLNKNKFLVDDKMRLCDLSCGTTVTSCRIIVPMLERHVKVKEWLENLHLNPCFEINKRGVGRLQNYVNTIKQNL